MKRHLPSLPGHLDTGWVIVIVGMVSMAFWFGLRTTFSVFFVALIDQFHWGRAEAAGAQSITLLAYTLTVPIIGALIDRVGPRRVVLPGIALAGLGLLLCTQIRNLSHFYLFFGVIVGTGTVCLSITPYTIMITHWFEQKRGLANGLAGVGIGLGPFLFVPLCQYLIHSKGWPFAYLVLALATLAIPLPLNALFLKQRREEVSSSAEDPSPVDFSRKREGSLQSYSSSRREPRLRELLKTGRFWALILFPSLAAFTIYVVLVHHVRYLVDLGVDQFLVASLFAALGALSAGFRFFWGWLSDRIGREIAYTLGGICFCAGTFFLLLFQSVGSLFLVFLFGLFFGVGWGATAPMFMSISGDLYKGKNFGLIYGFIEAMIGIGGAAGAWGAGWIFDRMQSYSPAFLAAIVSGILSIVLVWFVSPHKAR